MAFDPQWGNPRADETWSAWYLECMVHGTWNAQYVLTIPGMLGSWKARCVYLKCMV